jgi:hypothetical protein
MKPKISDTSFGTITVDGKEIQHDIVIRLDGTVKKRKKKLSKKIFGTSHIVSRDESKFIYEDGAKTLIIGAGQYGMLTVSDEAMDYFTAQKCTVSVQSTPHAIKAWNTTKGNVIGMFHITC